MFWSCKLYQLNPKVDSHVKSLLSDVGKEYEYKKSEYKDEATSLKVHISAVQSNIYGQLCSIDIDRIIYAFNREDGRFPVKITTKLDIQIFETSALPNFVGMFASDRIASVLSTAMTAVLRETQDKVTLPFFETYFLLKEKEKELRQYFDNMTEISIDGVRDAYIRKAKFKGNYLGESEIYEKYVKDADIGGNVEFFGVSVDERTVILVSEGVIYTRQGSNRNESLNTVTKCITNIQKANALRVKSDILTFE